jgi:hypothetical protein
MTLDAHKLIIKLQVHPDQQSITEQRREGITYRLEVGPAHVCHHHRPAFLVEL